MKITVGLPTLEGGYVAYVTNTTPHEVNTVFTGEQWIKDHAIETVEEYYKKAMLEEGWIYNERFDYYSLIGSDFQFIIAPREKVIDKVFPLRTTIIGLNFQAVKDYEKHVKAIKAILKL